MRWNLSIRKLSGNVWQRHACGDDSFIYAVDRTQSVPPLPGSSNDTVRCTRQNASPMLRDHRFRKTYAGRMLPRRAFYPGLLRHNRVRSSTNNVFVLFGQVFAVLLIIGVLITLALITGAYSAYAQVAASLTPRLDALNTRAVFETSRIYDRNGTLLYEFFDTGRRTRVSLDDVSPWLIEATIAIEDKTFFSNPGIDFQGMARTLYTSLSAGEETGGASTITQQVIKNIILTEEERLFENRYQRKFKEIILAQELNERHSKEEILELYLNEIYYGNLAYGIEAASESYFGIPARDLNLAQAALLAGLPQLPSRYDPMYYLQRDDRGDVLPGVRLDDGWISQDYQLPDDLAPPKWRQIAVLRQMVDEGYVTEAQARVAISENLYFTPQEVPLHAPHFVFYVRSLLEEEFGAQLVNRGGLEIYTTLDLPMQRMVQQKAAERIRELRDRNIHNASVVVMQPNTGQILAMVGSIDYNAVEPTRTPGQTGNVLDGQVNVSTRERQPGSALKPFTYLAAMERGMTPATILWDVPTEFPIGNGQWYAPQNYNERWNGPVRIRSALANSLNMPAVKALKYAGLDYTLQHLDRVGIKEGLKRGSSFYGLSLTLGGGEVTLLELTTAYNTLASGGRYFPPEPILKITDANGQVLREYTPDRGEQVVDAGLVSIITDMMSDDKAREPIWGLNSKLHLSRPAAVKTGTSNDWRDAWTVGYTPYLTVGVWSGNNNNEPTHKVESLEGGGVIWANVMEELFTWIDTRPEYRSMLSAPFPGGTLPWDFTLAPGLQRRPICRLPGPFGGATEELFTERMVNADGVYATAEQPELQGQIGGTCDFYTRVTVVRTGEGRYCIPRSGDHYPSSMLTTVTVWKTPPADPSERVQYRWSGGSAGVGGANFPVCSPASFSAPTPNVTATPVSTPVPPGAVVMPNLIGLSENQARGVLARLGITSVYTDYQGRNRIPDLYDLYPSYAVVSSLPRAGDAIMPGTTVVLGVREPDSQPVPAPPAPEPAPAPAPAPAPPDPAPAPAPPDPAPAPPAPAPAPAPPPSDVQPIPIFPQPPGVPVPMPGT